MSILSAARPTSTRVRFDSGRRRPARPFGEGIAVAPGRPWSAPDDDPTPARKALPASFDDDDELAPLEPDDAGSLVEDNREVDRLYQLAFSLYRDGHGPARPRGMGRRGVEAWARGESQGRSARWGKFYDEGLEAARESGDETPSPDPDADARDGWAEGQAEGLLLLAARLDDHQAEGEMMDWQAVAYSPVAS